MCVCRIQVAAFVCLRQCEMTYDIKLLDGSNRKRFYMRMAVKIVMEHDRSVIEESKQICEINEGNNRIETKLIIRKRKAVNKNNYLRRIKQ